MYNYWSILNYKVNEINFLMKAKKIKERHLMLTPNNLSWETLL